MARLNIEDPFWLEVMQIVGRVGDQDKAIGNAVRFFRYAQDRHKIGHLITEDEFKSLGFMEELFPLFAERTPDGIRAKGADKHFGWLGQKAEAGRAGGRISAQRSRDDHGRLLPKGIQAQPSTDQAETKHSQASSSLSSSLDLNLKAAASAKPRRRQPKFNPNSIEELRAAFDDETRKNWSELYPDAEFRKRVSLKAWEHYRGGNRNKPTTLMGWKKIIGFWFNGDWEKRKPAGGKSFDYTALASKLLSGVRQYGPGDSRFADYLGCDWDWVSRSRLLNVVRGMKDDDFARKRLAEDLRQAHERLTSQPTEVSA